MVDDEEDILEIAKASLETVGGWDVVTAGSGSEAAAVAQEHRLDAILLDVMMPDMDGPETIEKLRAAASTRDIPVVLLTAKVQASDIKCFESLGAAGILAKPFDPMTLASDVSRVLGWAA